MSLAAFLPPGSPPQRPRRAAGIVSAVWTALALWTVPAVALAQPDDSLPSFEVPGRLSAFARVLGLDPDAPRPRLMLSAIRVLWDTPDGQDALVDRRRVEARGYLETLVVLERVRTTCNGQPATLATIAARLGRDDIAAFATAMGAEPVETAGRWSLTSLESPAADRRRAWVTVAGLDPVALVRQLNAGEPVSLDLASDLVPAYFPLDWWDKALQPPPAYRGLRFVSLLTDRRAALIYHGAASLDGPTRAALTAIPPAWLHHDLRAPALSQFGRSLHVAGGRVLVPGGADAEPLWEAIVGVPVTAPIEFTAHLLDRDEGRLALFYDGVSHLEPDVQAFVLGRGAPHELVRLGLVRRVIAAASLALTGWDVRVRPFERAIFDATHVLMRTRMATGGSRPAGPWSRRFWNTAFEATSIPDPDARPALVDADEPPQVAWWLELIGVGNTAARRERAEAWLFAQRVFPAPTAGALPDVLTAVRGFLRFRALAVTLERIGITDPATYAEVVRAADRVSRVAGHEGWTTLAQFQGALAVVERARFHRAIDVPTATAWVRQIARLPLSNGTDFLGGVAEWLDTTVLTAVPSTVVPTAPATDRPDEVRLMALMSGAVATTAFGDPARMPTIEWEGLSYRVDPATATLRRMVDVRTKQGGSSLDVVLAVPRAARAIMALSALSDMKSGVNAMTLAIDGLRRSVGEGEGDGAAVAPDLEDEWAEARRKLLAMKALPSAGGLSGVFRALLRASDWYLARTLAAIVYAPNLGESDSPALLGGDPSPNHDFGLMDTRADTRVQVMWRLPAEARDRKLRWRVSGSLLGLDVALDRFALRRVPSEVMPEPPMLTDVERQALTEPVVLSSPFDYTDDTSRVIVEGLKAGRARVAAATAETIGALALEAGLDEWRAQMLPWMLAHEPSRIPDLWSLAEVLDVGLAGAPRPPGLDAWGVSGLSMDGQLSCTFPGARPWTTLSGRKGARLVAGLVADLGLALAEALAAVHIPARAASGVLAVATQELLDTVRVNHDDDWLTLVAWAKKTGAGRIDDYVAALTIGGPFVPAETESHHASDR